MIDGAYIIKKFETYVDDGTELSATDELDLLNKVYNKVWMDRPWEFAKKGYSVSINGVSIALPTDFSSIIETELNGEMKKVVYVGANYYRVVPFSERKNYQNRSGYCWLNMASSLLEFSESVSGTLTFDYIFVPADLTLTTGPAFPERFSHILYHLMAVDDYAIQQFDKARSYANENQAKADDWLERMQIWNALLLV